MSDPDADELAEAVGRDMYRRDHASNMLGINVDDIAPGFACCSMTVRQDMVNGHGMCHGGLIFTLADSAFALCLQRMQSNNRGPWRQHYLHGTGRSRRCSCRNGDRAKQNQADRRL